jgi:tetratricopeptide (TPR) repeat protein
LLPYSVRPQVTRLIRNPVPSFTGRSAELERLTRMLRSATGPVAMISGVRNLSGIGKTELACRLAYDVQGLFPLQILIDLRGQSETPLRPEQFLERVIRFLSNGEARLPAGGELEALSNLYRTLLSGQRVLLIADNARDAAQIKPLLPPPGCGLLCTSRNRILMSGASTYHSLEIDVLPHADSAALLRALCSRLSTAQAAELAGRVGHLPLALQILGNVLREDPTRQYADFLQQFGMERTRLENLRPGEATTLDVQAAIAMGWRNVDPWCRTALGQLTVMSAPFEQEIAEAVIALPEHASKASEVLRRLQKGCLLESDAKAGTFYFHSLIRAFVQSQSDTTYEQPTRARHAAYCIGVLRQSEQRYRQGHEGANDGLLRFDRDRLHIEAAQAWAAENTQYDDEAARRCIEIALGAQTVLTRRLVPRARLRWMEAALAAARRLGDAVSEAKLLGHIGFAYRDLGQPPRALELYLQSLQVARTAGDRGTELRALSGLGLAYLALGQPERAVTYFEPSLAIARELSDRPSEGIALGNLGLAHLELGQAQQAIAYFELDLTIARGLSDHRAEGRALGNLGLAHRMNGQTQQAIDYYDQHLKIARFVGDRRGEGNSAWNRALSLWAIGRRSDSIASAETALRVREELGDPRAEKVRAALLAWKNSATTSRPEK